MSRIAFHTRYVCPVCHLDWGQPAEAPTVAPHHDGAGRYCPMSGQPVHAAVAQ